MDPARNESGKSVILAAFHKQIGWCESLGSPFTAEVLRHLADDVAEGGTTAELIGAWPGDPVADALPLRLAGALHALVLTEIAPDLVGCYPPHDPPPAARLRSILMQTLDQNRSYIAAFLTSAPQTNEVGRSAILLGGFLEIARETGLPLRLLEIGTSAGLNTIWDRFHYRLGDGEWGDPASPVHLAPAWSGPLPPLNLAVKVVERRACDLAPIDINDAAQCLRLQSYVWADQLERLARLEGAISLAQAAGVSVERQDAAAWVEARLQEPAPGNTTVLYHSVMWQYLPAVTQADILTSIELAASRASAPAPFAWLRFEPSAAKDAMELRLSLWPGGGERRLATAHPHGSQIDWLEQHRNELFE